MEHRVKRARAHLVPMALQFPDHAQAKDWFFARMVENVYANQARQKLLVPDALDFC